MIVLKDYLSLKKGDIISFHTKGSDIICISVESREVDAPFYGNEKGRHPYECLPRLNHLEYRSYRAARAFACSACILACFSTTASAFSLLFVLFFAKSEFNGLSRFC